MYYSIRYLFYGPEEDENKKTTLRIICIEQKEDIENIKKFMRKLKMKKKIILKK